MVNSVASIACILSPLTHPDLFAIPDFAVGAMANWGLVTFRETALLYEEGVDPATNKQLVAVDMSHELAHQVSLHSLYRTCVRC